VSPSSDDAASLAKHWMTLSRSGATKFDFPPYSNLVAGFISNIRRFDVPPRRFDIPPHKFDFMWFVCLYIEYVHEYVQGA